MDEKATALKNELDKEDSTKSSTVTKQSDDKSLKVTYKGYETIINTETGSMTALTKGGTPPSAEPLKIGDVVDYTTSLNGVTLDAWKVFYVDGDYTYIILDGYLPKTAISNTMKTTYHLTTGDITAYNNKEQLYNVYAQNNRNDLIDAMTTKSNWDSLLTGTINGKTVNQTRTANVWAMGSPTLDLWVNSWNASYPDDKLYITTTAEPMSDGLTGYYIGDSANPTTTYKYFTINAEVNNLLYWVSRENSTTGCGGLNEYDLSGYWLASPSAWDVDYLCSVLSMSKLNGIAMISHGKYNSRWDSSGNWLDNLALRPVVCLPSNIVNQ